ncbi:ABC transporter ATP-binding protein [Mycoplasma mycoides subsp. mycoides]|uniref:ABC transporter, ATP-binding component (Na+?) n=3 Tax=Mycoplasma mycoides group TaxID=656088 RepID=Q6MTS3_MYCMS|nr:MULTISPECIES: ABC transporter ATP-binding protein [Mycoplasma mycoides group]CAE76963.1 ABC transporter, ATP-binding component (Na+?) [Mycoplasma mycoides subsp. mycoides SC str. PG1]ADK69434.1 ABC transporter, ATP-binding protein [Mycoplasma mycoides subsp. mycoides SC str. Gladysdale]AIZ55178.1 ABC transporter, ATP-binding protein [Mycoplasma mycoides subsp. mycoides]AME10526.1 ABC transporter ATP-binding protein [Mycoplasma mycoides subsp. mycoides]AME11533.1 ABC transporter ATP-binding 
MKKILEIRNLTKIYSKTNRGVFNISMNLFDGDFHAFIGENGAGKTTTIKTIIGAHTEYKGHILINNINIKKAEAKSFVGYVPEIALFPKELTSFEYLYNLAILSNISKKEAKQKIYDFLKMFNILNLMNEKPYNFSSGQKKKILLIQALLHDPKVLILDEPAANLDPTARFELFNFLQKINKEKNITILISSHILSEIDKYVNSVTLIHHGNILYSGIKNKNLEELFYEKVINN